MSVEYVIIPAPYILQQHPTSTSSDTKSMYSCTVILMLMKSSPCREQELLKSQLLQEDSSEVQSWRKGDDLFDGLHHVAGVDISFSKDNPDNACAMLAILTYPELEVRHVVKRQPSKSHDCTHVATIILAYNVRTCTLCVIL